MSYTPIYARAPNKFQHFREEEFTDRSGHKAILRIAVFLDRKGVEQEEVAQVKWLDNKISA